MWRGLPTTTETNVEHLRAEKLRSATRIEKKNEYLRARHQTRGPRCLA